MRVEQSVCSSKCLAARRTLQQREQLSETSFRFFGIITHHDTGNSSCSRRSTKWNKSQHIDVYCPMIRSSCSLRLCSLRSLFSVSSPASSSCSSSTFSSSSSQTWMVSCHRLSWRTKPSLGRAAARALRTRPKARSKPIFSCYRYVVDCKKRST